MDRREKAELDRYLTREPDYPPDCGREWGDCEEGEPHMCYGAKGHHDSHECGTCEAKLELSPDEVSSLEEPQR